MGCYRRFVCSHLRLGRIDWNRIIIVLNLLVTLRVHMVNTETCTVSFKRQYLLSSDMVLSDVGELFEMFKNSFPISIIFFIPILILLSPVSPVSAAHEFAALRMQQYDLHGVSYGKWFTFAHC